MTNMTSLHLHLCEEHMHIDVSRTKVIWPRDLGFGAFYRWYPSRSRQWILEALNPVTHSAIAKTFIRHGRTDGLQLPQFILIRPSGPIALLRLSSKL